MRTLIVGHRGTGKTAFLGRVAQYYTRAGRSGLFLDLDAEIERRSGRRISEHFQAKGEAAFRSLEAETFAAISRETSSSMEDVYVVAGGGFDPALTAGTWRVLWLRRATDADGRIFFDRPRLNGAVSALDEYLERFATRDERFRRHATHCLWIDEGLEQPDPDEAAWVLSDFRGLGGALTILPEHCRWQETLGEPFEARLRERIRWGVKWFELRDDLLNLEQMERVIDAVPPERILVSFRARARESETRKLVLRRSLAFDWPLEFGSCSWSEPRVLSLHERLEGQSIDNALARFPSRGSSGQIFKAALPVRDFGELSEGHAWQEAQGGVQDANRVFLPHSQDGRWAWYRLLQGARVALNFVREDDGSGRDQPTLLQWARRRRIEEHLGARNASTDGSRSFAAVLGDPVAHSRTPMEQREFFAQLGAPVFAIRVKEREWRQGALDFLRKLGLRWVAVTAPLKGLAFEACLFHAGEGDGSNVNEILQATNTLFWSKRRGGWIGTNTDLEGFRAALSAAVRGASVALGPVAVWGGGGTLEVVRRTLPEAQLFSVRSGQNRVSGGIAAEDYDPRVVVWAVGRSRESRLEPPDRWQPEVVIDLNYAESSPGREYALKVGCRYVSGLEMFRAQGQAQRRFWSASNDGANAPEDG